MRIPESVIGVVAQHDTAKRPIPRISGNAQHIVEVNLWIDARYEELATLSFAQEFEAALESQAAAGQHDNRIGRRCAGLDRRRSRKPNEPSKPQGAKAGDHYSQPPQSRAHHRWHGVETGSRSAVDLIADHRAEKPPTLTVEACRSHLLDWGIVGSVVLHAPDEDEVLNTGLHIGDPAISARSGLKRSAASYWTQCPAPGMTSKRALGWMLRNARARSSRWG
jgi:hypothetical protein